MMTLNCPPIEHSTFNIQHSYFLPCQRPRLPDGQIPDPYRPDGHAYELQHFRVERLDHPAHLPVASFADGHLEHGLPAALADPLHARGARRSVAQRDPLPKPIELLFAQML